MLAYGVRSARERSFEEAIGEMEVGRGLLAPEPRPLPPLAPWTRSASTQTEPQLEPATSTGVILPETGQFLLLCSLQLWQQLQRCRQTRARVPLFFMHFTSVLRKQFAANDTFVREANSYTRTLALRNSRLHNIMPTRPPTTLKCQSTGSRDLHGNAHHHQSTWWFWYVAAECK